MDSDGSIRPARDRGLPVVVGVDGSAGSCTAVRWAARYGDASGEPLRMVHALTGTDGMRRAGTRSVDGHRGAPQRSMRIADRILGAATAEAIRERPLVDVSARVALDTPAAALVEASSDASLLVVGSNGRGRWARLFSSVYTRLIAAARCPVIVVRGDWETPGTVVVAVDGSDSCELALRFAFLEAARRRRPLVAVRAWQTPPLSARVALRGGIAAVTELAHEDVVVSAWRSLNDTVGRWRAAFPDVVVYERLVEGDPETVLAGQTWEAGLVVVGSRGGGPLSGLLLGSTSQHLIHTAKCPVAVVRRLNACPDTPVSIAGPDGSAPGRCMPPAGVPSPISRP